MIVIQYELLTQQKEEIKMASSYIHLAIGQEINKKLNLNEPEFLVGSVAPDLSNTLKISNFISHFKDTKTGLILFRNFINDYKDNIHNPYELGYLVHLITDHIWRDETGPNYSKVFIEEYLNKINSTSDLSYNDLKSEFYQDFNSIDYYLFNKYNWNFEKMDNSIANIQTNVNSVEFSKMNLLIAQLANKNLQPNTNYKILDEQKTDYFINTAVNDVLHVLEDEKIIRQKK